MSSATTVESGPRLWSEEPSSRPDRRRIRARIGGLHCSLCTGTIEKALGRRRGVHRVAVSLTHEQALIEYDPSVARPEIHVGLAEVSGNSPPQRNQSGYSSTAPRRSGRTRDR